MLAMARPVNRNIIRTRHRPENSSRTDAPCHTRTGPPPGTPTSIHWKVVPVGYSAARDDQNGHDVQLACAAWSGLNGDGAGGAVASTQGDESARADGGRARVRGGCAGDLVRVPCTSVPPPVLPLPPDSAVTVPALILPLPEARTIHVITSVLPPPGSISALSRFPAASPVQHTAPPQSSVDVSSCDLGGNNTSETCAGFLGALGALLRP